MIKTIKQTIYAMVTTLLLLGHSTLVTAQFSAADMFKKNEEASEYDHCMNKWNREVNYFNCDCIKENTALMRQKVSDDTLENNKRKIKNLEKQIKNAENKISRTENASKINHLESRIAKHEKSINSLSKPIDPSKHAVSAVMRAFDKSTMCRSYDGVREAAYQKCIVDSERNSALSEQSCACEADAVAQYWMDSTGKELGEVSRGNVLGMGRQKSRKACGEKAG